MPAGCSRCTLLAKLSLLSVRNDSRRGFRLHVLLLKLFHKLVLSVVLPLLVVVLLARCKWRIRSPCAFRLLLGRVSGEPEGVLRVDAGALIGTAIVALLGISILPEVFTRLGLRVDFDAELLMASVFAGDVLGES